MVVIMQANIILTGIFFVLCSSVSHAEYDAADLGKLFTDKSQRLQIDAARSGKSSASEPEQVNKVNVSGYMKRSDGENVVWINGGNTLDTSKVGSVKVYPQTIKNNNKVPVSVDDRRVYIKPGEGWSKSTGKITDNY